MYIKFILKPPHKFLNPHLLSDYYEILYEKSMYEY